MWVARSMPGKAHRVLLVDVGEELDVLGAQLLAPAHQLGRAALVPRAGLPHARAGEHAHPDEAGARGDGDAEQRDAAVVDEVDAERQIARPGARPRATTACAAMLSGAMCEPGAERDVPHVLDDQPVARRPRRARGRRATALLDDRRRSPYADVAGRAGQRPAMDHADDGLLRAEEVPEIAELERVEARLPRRRHVSLPMLGTFSVNNRAASSGAPCMASAWESSCRPGKDAAAPGRLTTSAPAAFPSIPAWAGEAPRRKA